VWKANLSDPNMFFYQGLTAGGYRRNWKSRLKYVGPGMAVMHLQSGLCGAF
jgi:hypothetical protein